MRRTEKIKNVLLSVMVLTLIGFTVLFEFLDIAFSKDETVNRFLGSILPLAFGSVAVCLLSVKNGAKLFGKPQNWLYMIPCMAIAIDNFQFPAYFAGKMTLAHTRAVDFLLFALNCLLVGVFEEGVFRGVLFALLAGVFSKDKKGFLKTYIFSSVIFGATHILNVFGGAGVPATLLQVAYTTLTGGLFAFAFVKTKSVWLAALTHAVYNFCGLLFSESGLGTGAILDTPTVIMMTAVCVTVGAFILYKVWTYPERERIELYSRLGFGVKPLDKSETADLGEPNIAETTETTATTTETTHETTTKE